MKSNPFSLLLVPATIAVEKRQRKFREGSSELQTVAHLKCKESKFRLFYLQAGARNSRVEGNLYKATCTPRVDVRPIQSVLWHRRLLCFGVFSSLS